MRMKRSQLEQMVKEELVNHIKGLSEAGDVVDAEEDAEDKKKKPADDKSKKPEKKGDKKAAEPKKAKEPPEQPEEEDPADDKLEKDDEEEPDAEEDSDEGLGDELTGKTVQSVTHEPESKLVPGAEEIVIHFNEVPDPFRIIVSSSGAVKFFYKSLRNEL